MFEKLTMNQVKCSQYKLGVSHSAFLKKNSKNRYLAELPPDTHPPTHSLFHMYRVLIISSPYNSQL
jgi:hypothetical protein